MNQFRLLVQSLEQELEDFDLCCPENFRSLMTVEIAKPSRWLTTDFYFIPVSHLVFLQSLPSSM